MVRERSKTPQRRDHSVRARQLVGREHDQRAPGHVRGARRATTAWHRVRPQPINVALFQNSREGVLRGRAARLVRVDGVCPRQTQRNERVQDCVTNLESLVACRHSGTGLGWRFFLATTGYLATELGASEQVDRVEKRTREPWPAGYAGLLVQGTYRVLGVEGNGVSFQHRSLERERSEQDYVRQTTVC